MTNLPTGDNRRTGADRRGGADRRSGIDRRLSVDRERARRLPDEFAQSAGTARDRIAVLVSRHWPAHSRESQTALVDIVLPMLEGLTSRGAIVTEVHRERVEEAVIDWLHWT